MVLGAARDAEATAARLEAALTGALAVPGLALAVTPIAAMTDTDSQLWPEERATLSAAVPKRRREFAAGRVAARRALAALGATATAIPVGDGRAPHWPAGFCGSIAHDAEQALAITGTTGLWRSVGVDLEPDGALPDDVVATILTEAECALLASWPDAGRAARRVFAAKEAIFKALFPVTGAFASFQAAAFDVLPPEDGLAVATLGAEFGKDWCDARLPVHLRSVEGRVVCFVGLPA